MTAKQDQAEIRRLKARLQKLKEADAPYDAVSLTEQVSERWGKGKKWKEEIERHNKRLTLSEIIQLLLQRGRGTSGGVTLSRNARGIPQFEVSVPTGEECPTIDAAKAKAVAVYEELEARFPFYEAPSPDNGPRKA